MAVTAKCEVCGKDMKLTVHTVKALAPSMALVGDELALVLENLNCILPETQDVFMRNSDNGVEMICSKECMDKYSKEHRIDKKKESAN